MDRARRFLSSLAVVVLCAVAPAVAVPRTTLSYITDSACALEACTAQTAPGCRQGNVLFLCDTGTGFYVAAASVSGSFDTISSGTNLTATMVVGTGGSLATTGSGTIAATGIVGSGSTTSAVDLATAEVDGTLPVARGGTNATSWTPNRVVVIGAAPTALSSDAGLTYSSTNDDLTVGRHVTSTTGNVVLTAAGATVDGKDLDLVPAHAQIVNICPSGCEYTTLNAACAAETSTEANPIVYYVHAGHYTNAAGHVCSGEAYATITGDGRATIIETTQDTFTDYGAIQLGSSTNMVVENMELRGHRGIWLDGQGANLGTHVYRNLHIVTNGAAGNEDCIALAGGGAGTRLYVLNNYCDTMADAFTLSQFQTGIPWGSSDTLIYSSGNLFRYHSGGNSSQNGGWILRTPVCRFTSVGDTFDMEGAPTLSSSIQGYRVNDIEGTGCYPFQVDIVAPHVRVRNTRTDGQGGSAYGALLDTATATGTVNIVSADIHASTDDDTTGVAYAVRAQGAAATVVNVIGGKHTQVGGTTTQDIAETSGGDIRITPGTQYATTGGTVTIATLPALAVGNGGTTFTGNTAGPVFTDSDPSIGYTISNSDAVNNEGSGYLRFQSSAVSPEMFHLDVNSAGVMEFRDNGFAVEMDLSQSGTFNYYGTVFRLNNQFPLLQLGSGAASDSNELKFDAGTTDASLVWDDTNNQLDVQNVDRLNIGGGFDVGASCDVGDVAVDTGGATVEWCVCSASNTWGCWSLVDGTFDATGPAD